MIEILFMEKKIYIYSIILFYFSLYYYVFCKTDFDYHRKKRLNNGNYLIMSSQGIYLYNEEFNSKISLVIFENRLAESNNHIYSSDIAQFSKDDNGYIICLIKNETYILSKTGTFLQHITLDYVNLDWNYRIIPYGHNNNEFYYVIISINTYSKSIVIRKYIYNSSSNNVILEFTKDYSHSVELEQGISCQLMNYLNNKVITCFYGGWEKPFCKVFNTSDFEIIPELGGTIKTEGAKGGQFFVSALIPDNREKAVFCVQQDGNLICYGYDISNNNTFTNADIVTTKGCKKENILMEAEFFPETNEILVGCKGDSNEFYLGKYSLNFEFTKYNKTVLEKPSGCNNISLFHFIYSTNNDGYAIIGDIGGKDCVNKRTFSLNNIVPSIKVNDYPTDEPAILICVNYYNYYGTDCIDTIEDGYYCNDTERKTIDKCHDECISCDKGPTNENTNCNKCKNSKYVELGNCVSSCTNGIFIDPNDNSNLKCKCPHEKCEYCTTNSYQYEQCINCNIEKGYYPKYNDKTNVSTFVNCYIDPDGYYLKNNSYYKYCYSTCKKCHGHGNDANNNCKECYEGSLLIKEEKKCLKNCSYNYYYDSSNKLKCTENEHCPSAFPKLIKSTKRCVNNCNEDTDNMYEYNNTCYEECPFGTHLLDDNNYLCEEGLICPILYSYNRTVCLSNVPDGYFINSTEDKTIDKCHDNCKTCNQTGTNENNNCETCPDENTKYFDLGNCVNKCNNGYFIDNSIIKCKCSTNITCKYCSVESKAYNLCESCNTDLGYYPKKDELGTYINCYNSTTIDNGYYLNNETQQYESCHSNCLECSGHGSDINNNCTICKPGFTLIKNKDNIENCYSNCGHYYYFKKINAQMNIFTLKVIN